MQALISSAIIAGTALYAHPATAAVMAVGQALLTAKEKYYQLSALAAEIEQTKEFLSKIKQMIDASLDRELAVCNLFQLIDSVNAFQVFFRSSFMGSANHKMMIAWPAWYRSELRHGVSHVLDSLLLFQQEMDSYSSIVVEEILKTKGQPEQDTAVDVIPIIRKKLQQKNSKCAKAAAYWKKQSYYRKGGWDVCPKCHERSGDLDVPITKTEKYLFSRKEFDKRVPTDKETSKEFSKFLKELAKDQRKFAAKYEKKNP